MASRGAAAKAGTSARGGGGTRSRGGRGRGRQSATPASPSSPGLFPAVTRVERTPLEFLVRLQGRIRTWLQLPTSFVKVISEENPPMLRLQVHGCGNDAVPMVVELPGPRLLFLGRWWKSFARAHNLWDGHVLRFKLMAHNLLSLKIYGSSGACLGCCEENSSGTDSPSSRESDEDGSDGSDGEYGSDPP
ncbi:l-ascorbate oxidase-like protein [Hordeum vulgare]|nr:l-ascorbate oxidase-like protein [Hordeum vulgare]